MPSSKHKLLLICTESADVGCVDHPNTRPFLLTELWSCSNVSHQQQNSMKTALLHQKLAFSLFFFNRSEVLLESHDVSHDFSKYSENLFPNFSTCGGQGDECCILSFARFLMSSASDWAACFRPRPRFSRLHHSLVPRTLFCNFEWMMRLCLAQ